MERVPDRIKSFYRVNNVRRFRYDRPFHKGLKDRENEFKVNISNVLENNAVAKLPAAVWKKHPVVHFCVMSLWCFSESLD